MSIPSDGCTSGGARLFAHRKLQVAASPPPPTGALSSKLIGTRSTITARWSTSMSSIASSAVRLLHTSTTNNIMRKIKITVTINMEHMSRDEQIRFMIRLADEGLLPPCPPEIRAQYAKPENI